MKRNLIVACSTLALALSASTVALAAETAKTEETAKAPLYVAKCPSPCDFTVKSHDKDEVAAALKEHAKSHHNGMVLSDADANAMIKEAGPKK